MTIRQLHCGFALWAVFLVALIVWGGLTLIGSPATERLRRIDEQRLNDLRGIRRALERLCVNRSGDRPRLMADLPETLAELDLRARRGDAVPWALALTDPVTAIPYEYRLVGGTVFEVCARFDLPRNRRWEPFWNHPAGQHCFRLDLLDPTGSPPEIPAMANPGP